MIKYKAILTGNSLRVYKMLCPNVKSVFGPHEGLKECGTFNGLQKWKCSKCHNEYISSQKYSDGQKISQKGFTVTNIYNLLNEDRNAPNTVSKNERPTTKPSPIVVKPPVINNTIDFSFFKQCSQNEIIERGYEKKTIVNAGPGTGKTYTLIEKIKYMLSYQDVLPDEVLVLCFSKSAVEVIRNRLEEAFNNGQLEFNWKSVDVRTFDSFATYVLAWALNENPPLIPYFELERKSYDSRIEKAESLFNTNNEILSSYKHIFVDEVQDLVGCRARLVISILKSLDSSCGFTLLGDSCQALYDYLSEKDNHVMSSNQFYEIVFRISKDISYSSLNHNFRQKVGFEELTIPYRNAILSGNSNFRLKAADNLSKKIEKIDINMQLFNPSLANQFLRDGTLGILTRTNGQALQISSWLRKNKVCHILQRPTGELPFGSWIYNIFSDYKYQTITRDDFLCSFAKQYPLENAEEFWEALVSTQKESGQTHFDVDTLLLGILQNSRDPLLTSEIKTEDSNITVSNIHRSKGKEFDSVIIVEDVLSEMTNPDYTDELEHKVCYVALTRPRKKVQLVSLSDQDKYIYISKNEERRCYRGGGWNNHKYLSSFEIGYSDDVDQNSFAINKESQDFILKSVKTGDRIRFIKCDNEHVGYIRYKIIHEKTNRLIGYTSPYFDEALNEAMHHVFNNYHNIPDIGKYYPDRFEDIYVDRFETCISATTSNVSGKINKGRAKFWIGVSLSGFAKAYRD